MKYAIIKDGVVVNIAISDSPITEEWVQTDVAGIGWAWDGGTFTPPAEPTQPRAPISKIDYLRRFTQAERVAIRQAATSNHIVNDYIELLNATDTLHLDNPEVVADVNALEAAGLLAPGRAVEILA